MKMSAENEALRFYSLWAINGPLEERRLGGQLDEFQRLGLDGVVFHPRFFPGEPPYLGDRYLEILNKTILQAKARGLRFWIYDENGWPSGTANGRLYERFPEDVCQRLDLLTEPAGNVLTSFTGEGRTWHLGVREVRGIDCYNPEATRHFLETIHERHRQGLSAEAFDHVEAFFTDEPESGVSWEPMPPQAAVPWSRRMPGFLREHFGRDVTRELPLLFVDGEGAGDFRRAYWELMTDLFCRGFLDPYREWCERHGKLLAGHVKGEEHPLFQLPLVGSCQRVYRHFSLPGIDALERLPANHFFPRQASSVARQFGDGRCMVEAGGGAGWGSGPEDLERYLLWLGHQGLTDFVLHLSQYRLDSAAICDWPPSQPRHVSWREAYPEILRRVRREVAAASKKPRDTLVIAPYRGLMETYRASELVQTNIHNGSHYPMTTAGRINYDFLELIERLHARQVAYDVTDERTFEESATFEEGMICLGRGRYSAVVGAKGLRLGEKASAVLGRVKTLDLTAEKVTESPRLGEPMVNELELCWSKVAVRRNAFLIEVQETGSGLYSGIFCCPEGLPDEAKLEFIFPDDVSEIVFNGQPLSFAAGEDGENVSLAASWLRPKNGLSFRVGDARVRPFVWLAGEFLVRSRADYFPGPNSTLRTEGPLEVIPLVTISPKQELVEAGLPFAFEPVEVTAEIFVADRTREIGFAFPAAAPASLRVSIDGELAGFVWGPDWKLSLERELKVGDHTMRIEGIPSSYNYYGPHHHYLGDPPVVSPDQMRGVRNFADRPEAPVATHGPAFHFRPWSLPDRIRF